MVSRSLFRVLLANSRAGELKEADSLRGMVLLQHVRSPISLACDFQQLQDGCCSGQARTGCLRCSRNTWYVLRLDNVVPLK